MPLPVRHPAPNQTNPETGPVPSPPQSPNATQTKFFLALLLAAGLVLGWILWPFWQFLVLSFLLSGTFRPAYQWLGRRVAPWLASLLTCALVTLIVFVPLTLCISEFSSEAIGLYHLGKDSNLLVKLQQFAQNNTLLREAQALLAETGLKFNPEDISALLAGFSKTIGMFIYAQASSWAANLLQIALQFCMLLMVTFFLLMEFEGLTDFLVRLSPLPPAQNRLLVEKFMENAKGILLGNGLNGLAQGLLGGLLFALLDVKAPVLYGVAIGVLAFLPILGIGLVLLPAALVFLLYGLYAKAALTLVFYLGVTLAVHCWVTPRLLGGANMHKLLIFLAIIGGVSLFGLLGVIYGPLLVTAFLTLANLYQQEYRLDIPAGD